MSHTGKTGRDRKPAARQWVLRGVQSWNSAGMQLQVEMQNEGGAGGGGQAVMSLWKQELTCSS